MWLKPGEINNQIFITGLDAVGMLRPLLLTARFGMVSCVDYAGYFW